MSASESLDNNNSLTSRSGKRSHYRHYVLILLALTYTSSYMDRQIVAILLEDIKLEFTLSDTQLGLLSGLAFALFYSVMGIPIARLADQHNRTRIITIAVSVWSLVTALCGMVSNFWQLFLCRMGVGIGEAGGLAPAHSLISDYYAPHERSRALSIYSLGASLGMVIGLVVGGYVAQHYGWRWAFIAVGLPGLLLALLVKFTVKEPKRGALDIPAASTEKAAADNARLPMKAQLAELWQNGVYVYSTFAHVVAVFFAYSLSSWLPTLFLRKYELTQTEVGTILAGITLLGGVSGTLAGGFLSDWAARFGSKWRAHVAAYGLLLCGPLFYAAFSSDNITVASIFFTLGMFLVSWQHAPSLGLVQIVVKPRARAFAAALLFFFSNMLGLALGPLYIGGVSDFLSAEFGDNSLSVALMTGILVLPIAAFGFWRAGNILQASGEAPTKPA